MKIAITCGSGDLDSPVDERFGRATGFIVYDLDSGNFIFVDNSQALDSTQGAGIQAAKTVANAGAAAIITGNVGPKAHAALSAADISIYTGATGSVRKAVDDYRNGRLHKAAEANVEGHW
ncbi:MAG TPA: NifB/NifX family molybdenum-iron cluster-binding protein [Spirochaetota bacterium]|nr:NifB/NifX family molybdenum-iron cluster-binding protein [Spirochaetota bacterium]HSA16208.1 NifB/NifX family molybdenum-iron cluster-binding protein [Spirochaetota bacterium]